MAKIESVLPLKSFAPRPLEGADERSEAGLVFPNVGVPFHAANLRPFGAPPSKGRREKEGRICAANESTRAPLTPCGEGLYGGGFAAFLEEGILVSQPSPRGEGAPQGRIGHRRHERQMRKAEQRGI